MTITFGPLSGAGVTSSAGCSTKLRIGTVGYAYEGYIPPAAGTTTAYGRAALRVVARGQSEVSVEAAEPTQLVSGVATLQASVSGTSAYRQAAGGEARLRIGASGFGGTGGRIKLRLLPAGAATTGGTASAILIPQAPSVSAFGGLWFESALDTLSMAASSTPLHILVTRAIMALHDTPAPRADVKLALLEQLKLRDRLYAVLLNLMEDGLVVGDAGTYTHQMVERAASRLLLTGAVTGAADAYATVAAALVLGEAIDAFLLADAHDEVAFNAALADSALYLQGVLDQVELAATANPVHTGMVLVTDAVLLDDSVLTEAQLLQLLRDSVALSLSLALDNGQYLAWTVNTASGGVSTYENYPFNSFAKLGGRYYGAMSTGVFRLDGDTDDTAPIDARLRLGMSEMGTRLRKSYSEVYVGYTGNGQMLLRVIFTDDGSGEKRAAEYRMKPRPATGRRESRFETGRGISAVYFDFELENINGADFDLSNVDFQPVMSTRRTRG